MKIYRTRPTPKAAREAWDLMTLRYGREPAEILYGVDGWNGCRSWLAEFPHLQQFFDACPGQMSGTRSVTCEEIQRLRKTRAITKRTHDGHGEARDDEEGR